MISIDVSEGEIAEAEHDLTDQFLMLALFLKQF